MKTEYEIAKKNVKRFDNSLEEGEESVTWAYCQEHILTLQRWLGFLEKGVIGNNTEGKIKDIKQAIKHYEENKIK